MAFIEPADFCGFEEYRSGLSRRLHESQLQNNELYMLMMSLKSTTREAARTPIRLLNIADKSGIAVVHFAFLDSELNPVTESSQNLADGLLSDFGEYKIRDPATKESFRVHTAYLKDYFEDQFGGTLVNGQALSTAGSR